MNILIFTNFPLSFHRFILVSGSNIVFFASWLNLLRRRSSFFPWLSQRASFSDFKLNCQFIAVQVYASPFRISLIKRDIPWWRICLQLWTPFWQWDFIQLPLVSALRFLCWLGVDYWLFRWINGQFKGAHWKSSIKVPLKAQWVVLKLTFFWLQ